MELKEKRKLHNFKNGFFRPFNLVCPVVFFVIFELVSLLGIEQAGLKGRTVGGAQVSEKHAGFVINKGGATCADVLNLMEQVSDKVYAQFGVRLEPEVKILK